jgi:tetratricopeptide (TPR) repeat protein
LGDVANVLRSNVVFDDDKAAGEAIALAAATSRPNLANRYNLATLYVAQSKNIEAQGIFDALVTEIGDKKTIDTGIELSAVLFGRANAFLGQEKVDGALADLRQALTLDPENPHIMNSLGYTLADNNRNLDEALGFLNEAVRLEPRSGNIADSLGWVLFRLGRYPEALDKLEAAIALAPNVAEVAEHLGDVYWRTNRQVEARMEWQKAVIAFVEADDKARVTAKVANGLSALPVAANVVTN